MHLAATAAVKAALPRCSSHGGMDSAGVGDDSGIPPKLVPMAGAPLAHP